MADVFRKEFTAKTKRRRLEHAGGKCEACGGSLGKEHDNPIQYDHDRPCMDGGDNTFENCRAVGTTCCSYHADKSKAEHARAARADRIRRKHTGYAYKKNKIQSKGFVNLNKKKIPYRKNGIIHWNGKDND